MRCFACVLLVTSAMAGSDARLTAQEIPVATDMIAPAGTGWRTGGGDPSPVQLLIYGPAGWRSGAGALAAAPYGTRARVVTGGASAFAVEAIGGIAGAALGFGSVMVMSEPGACGEDLTCTLNNAASAVLLSTAGAAVGTYASGRIFDTEPSGWGSAAGALVGAAAAIGLDHVLAEANVISGNAAHLAVFALTQGTLAALGSRLGASLR